MTDREFMLKASCVSYEPEMFFPASTDRDGQAAAIRVCMDCPVFDQCDEYVRKTQPTYGIWAGRLISTNRYHAHRSPVLKPCGTEAAYQRHLHNNENPCGPCTRAHHVYRTETHARRKAKRIRTSARTATPKEG